MVDCKKCLSSLNRSSFMLFAFCDFLDFICYASVEHDRNIMCSDLVFCGYNSKAASFDERNRVDPVQPMEYKPPTKKEILKRKKKGLHNCIEVKDWDHKVLVQPNCTICLEIFKRLEKILEIPCHHIFHYECLKMWINEKPLIPSCPICLADLSLANHPIQQKTIQIDHHSIHSSNHEKINIELNSISNEERINERHNIDEYKIVKSQPKEETLRPLNLFVNANSEDKENKLESNRYSFEYLNPYFKKL